MLLAWDSDTTYYCAVGIEAQFYTMFYDRYDIERVVGGLSYLEAVTPLEQKGTEHDIVLATNGTFEINSSTIPFFEHHDDRCLG